jgi:hypothetical protein
MNREIPFSFLRDIKSGDVSAYADRQKINRLLRQKGVPININCLDVLISLWTLPPSSCRFEGLFDDMITLPKINPAFNQTSDQTDIIQKRYLESHLEYLVRHKMVKINDKKRYRMTKQGREIMERARWAIS